MIRYRTGEASRLEVPTKNLGIRYLPVAVGTTRLMYLCTLLCRYSCELSRGFPAAGADLCYDCPGASRGLRGNRSPTSFRSSEINSRAEINRAQVSEHNTLPVYLHTLRRPRSCLPSLLPFPFPFLSSLLSLSSSFAFSSIAWQPTCSDCGLDVSRLIRYDTTYLYIHSNINSSYRPVLVLELELVSQCAAPCPPTSANLASC